MSKRQAHEGLLLHRGAADQVREEDVPLLAARASGEDWIVPLNEDAAQAIRDQLANDRRLAGRGYEEHGLLFPTERGTPSFERHHPTDRQPDRANWSTPRRWATKRWKPPPSTTSGRGRRSSGKLGTMRLSLGVSWYRPMVLTRPNDIESCRTFRHCSGSKRLFQKASAAPDRWYASPLSRCFERIRGLPFTCWGLAPALPPAIRSCPGGLRVRR